jgi:hypothetical protein
VGNVISALSKYEEDISLVARVKIQSGEFPGGLPVASEEGIFLYRSGLDRRLISFKRALFQEGDEPHRSQNDLMVFADGSVLGCQAMLDDTLQQFRGSYNPHLSLLFFSRKVAGIQTVDRDSVNYYFSELEPSIWWIGRTPFRLYLEGELEIQQNPLDNNLVRFKTDGPYGEISFEAGEADGWLPRKFRIVKRTDSRILNGTAKEWFTPKVVAPDPTDVHPEGKGPELTRTANGIREIIWDGTASQFSADSQGRWSPRQMDVKKTVNFYGGRSVTYLTHFEFDSLTFSPIFVEGDFETNIAFPRDFDVTVDEAAHIPYKWDGKRPVPGISAPPQLDRSPIVAGGGPRLFRLIFVNILLLLAIMVFFWFRRRNT